MLDKILKIWETGTKLKWAEDSKVNTFYVMEFNYS